MAKKKDDDMAPAGVQDDMKTAPPDEVASMQREAAAKAKAAEVKRLEAQAAAAEAQAASEKIRAKIFAEEEAARAKANAERSIWVVVQQRRDKPVRLAGGMIPCRTPVQVNRKELRRLEGMMYAGIVQLIVGPLEKAGAVQDYAGSKTAPVKEA